MKPRFRIRGFTLIEVLLGGLTLVVAVVAILGAYVGQVTLNEHARNLSMAIQDADRIIEQIRQQTASCGTNLSISWPTGSSSWDNWLQNLGGGKSIPGGDPSQVEFAAVACQPQGGGTIVACNSSPMPNPVLVTVAVCWRHRNRTIGSCQWGSATPTAVPSSPAMLTTLVTCRG